MIKPILQNIIVKPFKSEEVSDGGIFVPESYRSVNNKVMVVATGNGTIKKPMRLKEGDIGFRVKDWGEPMIIDGELHYLMDQAAIIALQ